MAYTTTPDLELAAGGAERLVQLADWDEDGVADPAAIATAQRAADSLIDSYAAIRYAVPVESPSDVLISHAADETIYQLRSKRQMLGADDFTLKEIRDKWLEALSKGQVRPCDPAPPKSSVVAATRRVSTREVSRDKLKGYS